MSRAGSPSPEKAGGGSRNANPRGRTGATIYSKGRPPWYNVSGEVNRSAFIIGIAGGTASGKTTVADKIIESLAMPWCVWGGRAPPVTAGRRRPGAVSGVRLEPRAKALQALVRSREWLYPNAQRASVNTSDGACLVLCVLGA